MWTEKPYCECGEPATWVRHAQFSRSHPFCTDHAKQEDDFGKSNPPYFFWKELSADQIAPKHKTAVEGYEDSLPLLCGQIHRMRYDKVVEFYKHAATELRRQAVGDRARGRIQLAALLEEAAAAAEQQYQRFVRIWALCEPHTRK